MKKLAVLDHIFYFCITALALKILPLVIPHWVGECAGINSGSRGYVNCYNSTCYSECKYDKGWTCDWTCIKVLRHFQHCSVHNKRWNEANVCPECANALVKDRTLCHLLFSGNSIIPYGFSFATLVFCWNAIYLPNGLLLSAISQGLNLRAMYNGSSEVKSWSSLWSYVQS